MPEMSTGELRAAVLAAWGSDPGFVEELARGPAAAIESRYGPQAYTVRVVFPEANEMPILIPRKTPDAESAVARVLDKSGSAAPSQDQFVFAIVQRAWADPAFRKALVADPRPILDELLQKEYGRKLDDELEPVVHLEQDGECCIAVPAVKPAGSNLTESELEVVAGGGVGFFVVSLAAGAAVWAYGAATGDDDCGCE